MQLLVGLQELQLALGMLLTYKARPRYQSKNAAPCGRRFFRYPQSDDDDKNRESPKDDGQTQLNPSATISVCTKLS